MSRTSDNFFDVPIFYNVSYLFEPIGRNSKRRLTRGGENAMNQISQKGKFDAAHRVLNEQFKCFNLHGHAYHYELSFNYISSLNIGYPIDFKEIKRVACFWIDSVFDHAYIANPQDVTLIKACKKIKSRIYVMSLVDSQGFCNPTAENIAKELFFAVAFLMKDDKTGLSLASIRLFETENCFVDCHGLTKEEDDLLSKSQMFHRLVKYKTAQTTVD